jgi:hypothetical protein
LTYDEQFHPIAIRCLRAIGWIALALLVTIFALSAPLLLRSRTVQYYVYPSATASSADVKRIQNPGCELYGKVIERNGEKAIRYRFPNDPDLESCFMSAVPSTSRIEKASWLDVQLNQPRPIWL